jgi:hypothetical protein
MHPREVSELVVRAGLALRLSQGELGTLLGVSRRTISRWTGGGARLIKDQGEALARALHPVDVALARKAAEAGGSSLVALGLDPAVVAQSAKEALAANVRRVRTVLYEAADAIDASPRAVRPALLAAFRAASAEGLSLAEATAALEAMAPPPPAEVVETAAAPKAKARKR